MGTVSTGRRAAAAFAAAAFALGMSPPAQAAENGVGFYLLGSRGPMAGYVPPPGVYLQNDFYVYSGSASAGKSFPAGGQVIADVESRARIDFVTGTWVLPAEILGGNLAIGAVVPFGYADVNADIVLSPANLGPVGANVTDSATVFGDPVLSAALGWHSGKFHWNVAALVNVPIGNYQEGEIANLAFHRWGTDLSAAVTWLDPDTGLDLSAAAGVTFNGTNEATDYTTGTEFHVEWALSKALTKQLSVGLVGYHYQQLSGDSGPGARLGAFEGRVTGLGGTVGYNFELGKTPVSTRLKLYREFNAENRMEGTAGFFTVALPLSAGN